MTEQQSIIYDIIQACRQSSNEIQIQDVLELQNQLKILEEIVSTHEEEQNEKSREFWARAKMGVSYYFKGKAQTSYTQALEAITKILDILRGEPLTITIQKIQRNSKGEIVDITLYTGKEANLKTKYNSKYRQVEYDLQQSLNALDKVEKANKTYIEHYSKFYNLANEHIKSTRSHSSSTGWRKRVNEGNIVEAYQRHMQMKHLNANIETESFIQDFTAQDILILLYYSVGKTPWWQQGDIGYNQIKSANNARLASASSIRRVATKILSIFSVENEFNIDDFNEMFTAQDQNQMTDLSKLEENELDNLLKEVKETNLFKMKI